jgi:hypothetical protein
MFQFIKPRKGGTTFVRKKKQPWQARWPVALPPEKPRKYVAKVQAGRATIPGLASRPPRMRLYPDTRSAQFAKSAMRTKSALIFPNS